MPTSPYRSLSPEKRAAVVKFMISASKEGRALFIQRLAARNGFRPVTLQAWPAERLAKEIVRTRAETADDELNLLHTLFVEMEPQTQATFLDAAGVKHENGVMDENLEPPYADADAVRRGVEAVRARHGEDGELYIRTLARYSADGWPGIGDAIAVE